MEEKFVEITENGIRYRINTSIRVKRLETYFHRIKEGINYKNAFDELIYSEEFDISTISDINKQIIIDKIIEQYELNKYEIPLDGIDIYEKIYKLLQIYYQEKLDELAEGAKIVLKSLQSAFQMIREIDIIPKLETALAQLGKMAINISAKFSDIDLKVEERNENHKKWAGYGWTIINNASFDFFYVEVNSQEDADEKCLSIITDESINDMFNYILENIKQKDKFIEAIKCFENKCYLATAMIITSLIERNLTELPMESPDTEKPKGKNIINKFKEQFNLDEISIIQYFYFNNFFEYIKILFERGDDFKEQRYNVNRNFLMHGWRDVETTKTDCIKLFLALYNLLLYWENK